MVAFSITHSTTIRAISGSAQQQLPLPLSVIPCGQPKFNSKPIARHLHCLISSCQLSRLLSAINETIIALWKQFHTFCDLFQVLYQEADRLLVQCCSIPSPGTIEVYRWVTWTRSSSVAQCFQTTLPACFKAPFIFYHLLAVTCKPIWERFYARKFV